MWARASRSDLSLVLAAAVLSLAGCSDDSSSRTVAAGSEPAPAGFSSDLTGGSLQFLQDPASTAPAPVLATGQLATFAAGDDGDLQRGYGWPVPRFTDNGDGTVTDELTGLMWTRNAHLDSGSGMQTWQGALNLVSSLNGGSIGGYTDWRLPNINELESLVDYGRFAPALPMGHPFQNVQPGGPVAPGAEPLSAYWSSTAAVSPGFGPTVALSKSFHSGGTYPQDRLGGTSLHVWAVRGGAGGLVDLPRTGWTQSLATGDDGDLQVGVVWPSPRFELVADGNGNTGLVVLDHLTGLMWTRDANLNGSGSWAQGLTIVEGMNLASTFGYADWRLPNARELRSLLDYSRSGPPLPALHPFLSVQPMPYWSSTTYAGDPTLAGVVSMDLASDLRSFELKGVSYGVWAVRSEGTGVPVNQAPVADAGADQSVTADSSGTATVTLDGSGSSDPDGDPLSYAWSWSGGTASGQAPTISLGVGTTAITLTVDDGNGGAASDVVTITVAPYVPANQAPLADAGADQTARATSSSGAAVSLDGTASSDPDGDPLTYAWAWSGGSASGPAPTVTLPAGTTTVTLTVDDGNGGSDSDVVVVTVTPNGTPVADAGPDQTLTAGLSGVVSVTLDGSGSSDPDGDALTYAWSGSFGAVSGQTVSVSLGVGVHHVLLTVNDNYGGSDSDQVQITVEAAPVNQAPSANAGPDQTVTASYAGTASVTLDGSGSSDPDGDPLTYGWSAPFPAGVTTSASLGVGVHTITLTVHDGELSASDQVVVTVLAPPNRDPVADAGPDQVVQGTLSGALVTLNGAGSSDPDGDPLSYLWSSGSFSPDASGVSPQVVLAVGVHAITLTVDDGNGGSASDVVQVTVLAPLPVNEPPVADAGADQTHEAGEDGQVLVTLDGSGSSDPDGDDLTYTWSAPFSAGVTSTATLGVGVHEIQLTVSDGELSDSDVVVITVTAPPEPNLPPQANAGGNKTLHGPAGQLMVTLDGSDSSDPDGDEVTCTWTGPFGSVEGTVVQVQLPAGESEVTLTVSDGDLTDSDTATVTIVDCVIQPGTYRLINHRDGSAGPPGYGLRLDELVDVSGGHDVFTFDFEAPGAAVYLDFDAEAGTLRIYGTAYGGRDTGSEYDPNWVGTIEFDFTYAAGVGPAPGDDDLHVTAGDLANTGEFTFTPDAECSPVVSGGLWDFGTGMKGYTFRLGDEDDDQGHRGAPLSGWGWLNHVNPNVHTNSSDWLFEIVEDDSQGGGGEGQGPATRWTASEAEATHTGASGGHAFWLDLPGGRTFVHVGQAWLEETESGALVYSGRVRSVSQPGLLWDFEVYLVPSDVPPGGPKLELRAQHYVDQGGPIDPSCWSFYTIDESRSTMTGLGMNAGQVLTLDDSPMPYAFQLGVGANGKNLNLGLSGWLVYEGECGSGGGDINVDLTPHLQE